MNEGIGMNRKKERTNEIQKEKNKPKTKIPNERIKQPGGKEKQISK